MMTETNDDSNPSCRRITSGCVLTRKSVLWKALLVLNFIGAFMHSYVSGKRSTYEILQVSTISTRKPKLKERIVKPAKQNPSTLVLQIIETELFVNGTWHHPTDGSAWTHPSTGETMVHPLQYELDNDDNDKSIKQWQGEWKIAITGRSSRGWTYYYDQTRSSPLLQYTIRRRTWLRTIIVNVPLPKRRRRSLIPSSIAEDWNFKGYGWTLYKSLVFPKSFGVGFRIPLTTNFASWETYKIPATLSISISAFNARKWPALNFNASVRMEWIQWVIEHTLYTFLPAICCSAFLVLLHGLLVAVNAVLYPFVRRSIWNDASQQWLWRTYRPEFRACSIQYASDREERLGISWTYRFGDRMRWSVWHFYAWQLPSIFDWITRRSAALGWTISGPVVNEPELLCSASINLLLSGYYFQRRPDSSSVLDSRTNPSHDNTKTTVPSSPYTTVKELKETKRQVAEALMK